MRRRRAEQAARERRPNIVAPLEEAMLPVENGKKSALAGTPLRTNTQLSPAAAEKK